MTARPQMRQTRAIVQGQAIQDQAVPQAREMVIEAEDVVVRFDKRRSLLDWLRRRPVPSVRAVDGVSLAFGHHETIGLVGESGSGKTTLGRTLLGLYRPSAGRVRVLGRDLAGLRPEALRALRRQVQMVFQDPYSSLNPKYTVGTTLAEVLQFHDICPKPEVRAEVARLLELVGLSPDMAERYPRSLSGGQRQRVGLARALAVRPTCLILDEPVAALDVSIQAQVLNLLQDLRDRLGLTMLFIAHELSVVRYMSTKVAVMYLGKIVEIGAADEVFRHPRHPYTQSLLKSAPRLVAQKRRREAMLKGDIPSPLNVPPGCRFHPRCPMAEAVCREQAPPAKRMSETHVAHCHFA